MLDGLVHAIACRPVPECRNGSATRVAARKVHRGLPLLIRTRRLQISACRRAAGDCYHRTGRMRCPYLEQILRKRFGIIKYFAADCHVDRRTHNFYGLRWPVPPCLGDHQSCELYVRERTAEDLRLRRYTD